MWLLRATALPIGAKNLAYCHGARAINASDLMRSLWIRDIGLSP